MPGGGGELLPALVLRGGAQHPVQIKVELEIEAAALVLLTGLHEGLRALGLTPSQVRALPAAEVDRVLDLLAQDAAANPVAAPRRSRRPRLADHPDAVVILAED